MKNFIIMLKIAALTGLVAACSESFLDEELITKDSTQSFETAEGLDKLAIGMYKTFEFHFNYEWAYTLQNYGTDEMSVGNDAGRAWWNDYTSTLSPASGDHTTLWDNMYGAINSANILINNVPQFYSQSSANYNIRLGEGYFVRGFNYFVLVSQFGGVPLLKAPVQGAQTDFVRDDIKDCYELILSDLQEAYNLLPTTVAENGRLTKFAAAHYLAKVSLFRASESNDSWNSSYKETDLANVIKYAKEVIDNRPLCSDFVELWDFTKPNGPNESVSEVVLAAQFSDETSSQGRYGNQVHLYYPSIYQNLAGLKRDISGDREFSRMRTTDYSIEIFDRVNDSRFWKSFITSYICNNPTAAPKWEDPYTPEGKKAGDFKFVGGEEGCIYIVNDAGDERFTSEGIKYMAPHVYVRYFKGDNHLMVGKHGNFGFYEAESRGRYIALSKFRDGSRESIASQFGRRDGIMARSAEDYLMIAEALGRQGKYSDALPYINKLRERAGYAAGEDRAKNVDGGQAYKNNSAGHGSGTGFPVYSEKNTYYLSNNMDVTTDATKSALQFASVNDIFNSPREFYSVLGANSDAEKFLCFILNERSRELMGELFRWTDLARTKQIEKRWRAFNDGNTQPGASFDPAKHYLRPIPQSFLDAITNNGKTLTDDEKAALQNPGY